MKQILLTMNEKSSFIIEDLDDYHLVIKSDEEYRVRKELEAEVRLTLPGTVDEAHTRHFHSWRRIPTAWRHNQYPWTVCILFCPGDAGPVVLK